MRLEGTIEAAKPYLTGGELRLPRDGTGAGYVRAESVRIGSEGPLAGRVETVTFAGTHDRIGISGTVPELLTSIHTGHCAPKIGETVEVAVLPEALMLLPAGGSGERPG